MNKFISFIALSMLLWICSCVEPFSLVFDGENVVLTIDGTLTDLDEPQSIKIIESISYAQNNYPSPVKNARVEILVDRKEKVVLTETVNGVYAAPSAFRTKTGSSYQLLIEKSNGKQYRSGEETMIAVPEIAKVYDKFMLKGIPRGADHDAANYIYLDTQDPANQKNNYMWSWKLWELQDVCTTCENGRYFTSVFPNIPAGCKVENTYINIKFDYLCDGNCWDIFFNKDLNVFSDIYSNGKVITGKLIAKIPYYQEGGSLLEIKQQSISPDAYHYLKLLADQVQNNGSLVDTPPAAIIGNVRNINDDTEAVAGLFMVTSIKKIRYWLSRENAQGKAVPLGLLDHTIILEPAIPEIPDRPPLALCIEGTNRTKKKPEGWIDRKKLKLN